MTITASAPSSAPESTDPVTTARHVTVTTPDGPFTVVADADGAVLASGWTADPTYLTALIHPSLQPAELVAAEDLTTITDAVAAYYAGRPGALDVVRVRQRSGPFLQQAWEALRTVPAGEPVTYTRFAEIAGNSGAIRAAAAACSRNAAALFVPCHRVVRTDGTLGGFRYGLEIKRALIDRERSQVPESAAS